MPDIERVVAKGDKHRSVANTVMNTNRCVSITSTTHYLIQYQLYLTIPLVSYSDRHLTVPNTHWDNLKWLLELGQGCEHSRLTGLSSIHFPIPISAVPFQFPFPSPADPDC